MKKISFLLGSALTVSLLFASCKGGVDAGKTNEMAKKMSDSTISKNRESILKDADKDFQHMCDHAEDSLMKHK